MRLGDAVRTSSGDGGSGCVFRVPNASWEDGRGLRGATCLISWGHFNLGERPPLIRLGFPDQI